MALKGYTEKRNFQNTPEPEAKIQRSKGQLIFVVQRHAATRLHYDFRLEMDGVLKSWAIPKGPSLDPNHKRLAMMVEDHPYAYRNFEGTIPKGNYGAGQVEIWDQGTYEPLHGTEEDLLKDLAAGSLKIKLEGKKLKGEFALVKLGGQEQQAWLLIKHRDAFAERDYDAEEHVASDSLVSRYLATKRKKKGQDVSQTFRKHVKPMLAKTATQPFDDADWVFEIKWDGYRALADLRGETPLFYSRNGLSFGSKFEEIVADFEQQQHQMILDGEVVAFDDKGNSRFQYLQTEGEGRALAYQVFDLLWLNGHSLTHLPLLQRKELLREALVETQVVKYGEHIQGEGKAFFAQAKKMGIEGVMAKRSDSTYSENQRSDEWLKLKISQTEDALICGFTAPRGSGGGFGALVLGRYVHSVLTFCGHVGTGFTRTFMRELHQVLLGIRTPDSPFSKVPKTNMPVTWVRPELVCEVKFTEITKDGRFRHPVFMRLREDADVSERGEESKFKPTNLAKIYFPKDGLSKGDVIAYYLSIAAYILPYLRDRPLSLNRFPNGIEEANFYHKDAGETVPSWIKTTQVYSESTDKFINYVLCNDMESLAYLVNLGCIDFNPWNSTVPQLDRPDYLVLDLDPSEKNRFEEVLETALEVREVLEALKIAGYCKTSGSTGLHIYLPMGRKYDFEQVKNFAHLLMQEVHRRLPTLTTLERSLQKRDRKKIYLDYLQNRSGQTLASVFSLRPKEGATVSMPVEWHELAQGIKVKDFTIYNALDHIQRRAQLFQPVLGEGIDMLAALERFESWRK